VASLLTSDLVFSQTAGERLPSVSRTMEFAITVRDNYSPYGIEVKNKDGRGCSSNRKRKLGAFALQFGQLTVDGTKGPFAITTASLGNGANVIRWNVAGIQFVSFFLLLLLFGDEMSEREMKRNEYN
jgi:hypothetical protein